MKRLLTVGLALSLSGVLLAQGRGTPGPGRGSASSPPPQSPLGRAIRELGQCEQTIGGWGQKITELAALRGLQADLADGAYLSLGDVKAKFEAKHPDLTIDPVTFETTPRKPVEKPAADPPKK